MWDVVGPFYSVRCASYMDLELSWVVLSIDPPVAILEVLLRFVMDRRCFTGPGATIFTGPATAPS